MNLRFLRMFAIPIVAAFMIVSASATASPNAGPEARSMSGMPSHPFSSPSTLVYFQNPDFNGANSSQNDTTVGGFGLFAQVYDNFTLGGTTSLSSVQWVGSYFNPATQGPITAWTLQIYGDSGGQPGTLLYNTNVGGTAGETFIGLDNVGDPTYLYTLAVNFSAAAGTQYWLSVYPDLAFPPQWGWETATGGDGVSYQDFFGSRTQLAADEAFALFAGTTTPEPGTLVLLGSGILGLAGTLRRKLL
jgi:hypothetical protein